MFPQKGFPGKSRKSDESKRHHPMVRNWINLYTKFRHHPMVRNWINLYTKFRHHPMLRNGINLYTKFRHRPMLRNWINLYTKFRHHPMLRNGINLYTKFRHHPMLRNWINLCTKFHLKQTILIFWTKFTPSMKYKKWTSPSTSACCISSSNKRPRCFLNFVSYRK